MIHRIKITLNNGREVVLKGRPELENADKTKEINLVMDNGQIYHGYLKFIDEDEEDICIGRTVEEKCGMGLPLNRLIGWYYE